MASAGGCDDRTKAAAQVSSSSTGEGITKNVNDTTNSKKRDAPSSPNGTATAKSEENPPASEKASTSSATTKTKKAEGLESSVSTSSSNDIGGKKKKRSRLEGPSTIAASSKGIKKKHNGSASSTSSVQYSSSYKPLTLSDVKQRVAELCEKVPLIPPEGLSASKIDELTTYAKAMQAIIEQFNLVLCCVSSATYKWGTDRTGAADQNLGVLGTELSNAQEQIGSAVSPRLNNVLSPVVDLVTVRTITTKTVQKSQETETNKDNEEDNVVETKTNEFGREIVDPSYLQTCRESLARNAPMLRQVLMANFYRVQRVIEDYEKATKKDSSHDRGGFAY